jgi:hypothetical protein
MSLEATRIIQSELESRETLLWVGQPQQGVKLRGSDIFLIPFSLIWGGGAFFWEYSVIQGDAPLYFLLFGVPFVVIGLYLIIGRFFFDAKQREKTFYGLSNERIIIITGLFRKQIKSLSLRTLADISISESSNGIGSITFGGSNSSASMFESTSWPGMEQYMGTRFSFISNAKQIYHKIVEAQKQAS